MDMSSVVRADPDQAVLVAAMRDLPDLPPIDDELRLAAVTSWHRLGGVLGPVLDRHEAGSDDLRDHLRTAGEATAHRWDGLRARLGELLAVWSDHDITATVLKGAALVEAGVVSASARPMADLDVLVAADHAEHAHRLARDIGFASRADDRTWDFARTRHHHLPILDDDHGTVVEVHHRLLDGSHPQRRLDDLVRGRTVELDHLPAARLDDVALWLHLAIHCWDDRRRGTGGPLLQFRDLDLLLGRVDQDDLADTVARAGVGELVSTILAVLEAVLPSSHAASLRRVLDGPSPDDPAIVQYVRRRVLGRRTPLAQLVHPTGSVDYTAWRLLTRARRQVFPPRRDIQRALGPTARHRDHFATLGPVLRDAMAEPAATWDDIRLDRWALMLSQASPMSAERT